MTKNTDNSPRQQTQFTRVIVFYNPASTNAEQTRRRIDDLKAILPSNKLTVIETSPKGRQANKRLLLKHSDLFGPKTLLCVAAGDGTVNVVAEALAETAKEAAHTVILPLWGGNGNDVAHMLNGPTYRISTERLLDEGHVVTVRPLRCTLTDAAGSTITHFAVGYVGFGATARVARGLNDATHRTSALHRIPGGRIALEWSTVARVLIKAPPFKVEDSGREHQIYERNFINGSRMAKIRPFRLRLTDDAFYTTTYEKKRLDVVLKRIRNLFQRPAIEKMPASTTFRCIDRVWVQFDGETVRISPGTTVEVSQSPVFLHAWSTRLPATRSASNK